MHTHIFSYILYICLCAYTHTYINIRIYKCITNDRCHNINMGQLHCSLSMYALQSHISQSTKIILSTIIEKAYIYHIPVPGMCNINIHTHTCMVNKYICSYMYICIFIFNMLMCTLMHAQLNVYQWL